jgi:hypothetical protein
MLNLNGIICETIEQLESEMTAQGISEDQKVLIRNDFNDVPNTPVAAIAPVTNQQLRTALVLTSYYQNKPNLHPDAIKTYIESLSEPSRSLALQQWEYSNEMKRDNQLVGSMAAGLGLTAQDLDTLWLYASTL